MKVRAFYTTGNEDITEYMYDKPDVSANEIEVKNIYTGICSSDVAMYQGKFQTLSKEIQGHEGLGCVTKIGSHVRNIEVGDFVATRGEPAFADYYNTSIGNYVQVPSAKPKYILEPVACAINISNAIKHISNHPILLLGSGWLASIIHKVTRANFYVVGKANKEYWESASNVTLVEPADILGMKFETIVDLSDKAEYLEYDWYANNGEIILAAEKSSQVKTDFSKYLWAGLSFKFPSPRNYGFYDAMLTAKDLISDGVVDMDDMWTHEFDRNNVKQAFEEAAQKSTGYKRGYISWA